MRKLFLFFHTVFSIILSAQDGSLDTTFNSVLPNDVGTVMKIVMQPDSKVLVMYHKVGATSFNNYQIVRLNPNGSLDDAFQEKATDLLYVSTIDIQPDGKILVGGYPRTSDKPCLLRLHTDGSIDQTFVSATIPLSRVSIISQQPDNKILVLQGERGNQYITRLNPDGTLDNTYSPTKIGSLGVYGIEIFAIAVQADGIVLAGGAIGTYYGVDQSIILKIDANGFSNTFVANQATTNFYYLKQIVVQPDGKILLATNFVQTGRPSIVRVNSDYTKDNTFNYNDVNKDKGSFILLQPDGKIIVNIWSSGKLIRINSDGSNDNTFLTSSVAGATAVLQKDSKILVGLKDVKRINNTSVMNTLDLSKNHGIITYPNPVKNILNIKTDNPISSYEIYSLDGRKLMEQNKLNNSKIDVSNLTKGNYLIKLKSKGKEQTTKFIKE